MEKPEQLVLDADSYSHLGWGFILIWIGTLALGGWLVLTRKAASLSELILPLGAISVLWIFFAATNLIIRSVLKSRTRREINRLFEDRIWEQWQFRADEWEKIVTADYRTMCGENTYVGVVYSSLFGFVFSLILAGAAIFVIKDEQVTPILITTASGVLLLFFGIGLAQTINIGRKARIYRRKALEVAEPRVWFGAEGAYHEALGYTSLKRLEKAIDQSRRLKRIKFVVTDRVKFGRRGHPSDFSLPVYFSIPSGYEQQAGRLVRRYRQERLA